MNRASTPAASNSSAISLDAIPTRRRSGVTAMFIRCQTSAYREQIRYPSSPSRPAIPRQIPDGFESSSTNIASDHGVVNERRSIASTDGRSP